MIHHMIILQPTKRLQKSHSHLFPIPPSPDQALAPCDLATKLPDATAVCTATDSDLASNMPLVHAGPAASAVREPRGLFREGDDVEHAADANATVALASLAQRRESTPPHQREARAPTRKIERSAIVTPLARSPCFFVFAAMRPSQLTSGEDSTSTPPGYDHPCFGFQGSAKFEIRILIY